MHLDLFLRVRRDRFNLAIRLRLLASAAAVISIIIMVAGTVPGDPIDPGSFPLIVITARPAHWQPAH